MQMRQAMRGNFLTAFDSDVEYLYMTFLRIVEVFKLGTVCRTLCERVRASTQSKPWDVVHCDEVDPAGITWLAGIAKLGVKLRSIHLVGLQLQSIVIMYTMLGVRGFPWI